MEGYFMETKNLKALLPTGSLVASTTGVRVSMKHADRLTLIALLGASTASTGQFTLRQHTAATGGTSKDLVTANPYFVKGSADDKFTKVEPTSAAALVDVSTKFSTDSGILVLEVMGENLDTNNGFTHVSVDIAAAGTAKQGTVLAVLNNPYFMPGYEQAL